MYQKYAQIMHTWMFGALPIDDIFQSIKAAGFDGVDLSISDHESYSIENFATIDIKGLAQQHGLEILAASALMKGPNHDLSQKDDVLRTRAIRYVKQCVDAAVHGQITKLLVMPSRIFNTSYYVSREEDWDRSVKALKECGQYALEQGVTLLLEPLNRQRVTLVRTLDEGVTMISDVGLPNLALVPDIYQMTMEEPCSIAQTLYKYSSWIQNVHVADSTRHVPGTGHYPWGEILISLYDGGYRGVLSHEPVFRDFSADRVGSDLSYRLFFEAELKTGVQFLNAQMNALELQYRPLQ